MNKTNWDQYYNAPAITSSLTRKITTRKLKSLMEQFYRASLEEASILELGGANSCFYDSLWCSFKPRTYTIIDNNEVGLERFKKNHPKSKNTFLVKQDLLNEKNVLDQKYDIVFSVGLIEHFSPEETQKIIRSHFNFINPGGIVVIAFPISTWLYRTARKVIEYFGLWAFPDERPLTFAEVNTEISKYAIKIHEAINWSIILTQGIVVYSSKEYQRDLIPENGNTKK
jgi:2-polyprenyl-3-methyl-5-hydroxy-6-metoxy-1,4-benzoquinol methylase